mmetsp:Transcript_21817/g.43834  ORF Transcript_21817/g.43834 Transcript_21817/m.43834 type:complete len:218 (-) Transcript_21817:299-952(-)
MISSSFVRTMSCRFFFDSFSSCRVSSSSCSFFSRACFSLTLLSLPSCNSFKELCSCSTFCCNSVRRRLLFFSAASLSFSFFTVRRTNPLSVCVSPACAFFKSLISRSCTLDFSSNSLCLVDSRSSIFFSASESLVPSSLLKSALAWARISICCRADSRSELSFIIGSFCPSLRVSCALLRSVFKASICRCCSIACSFAFFNSAARASALPSTCDSDP